MRDFDGTLARVFRCVPPDVYGETARKFLKFKGLVYGKISSEEWCRRHGVEIVDEIPEIEPVEVFFISWRLAEGRQEVPGEILDFIGKVGDRIPVSDDERVYLFPRELYEKVLVFGVAPP